MFSDLRSHCCFCNRSKMMAKRKRLVSYSDSESDDDSPKKKYLKKEESDSEGPPKKKPVRMITESDSEDEGSPKKKPVRMIVESDSEDLSKKKPVRMIVESDSEDEDSTKKNPSQTNDEKTIDMRNLYDFNDVDNKKSRKFRTESHVFTASFKRFQDLRPHQLNALFDDVTQQIKQKLNAEPSDMIRLSINHPSLDIGIHIPFMCADQLEGTVLLDQIEKVSQSNTEFKLNDGLLKMDITHTKPPRGSGKPKRLTTELDSKVFAQKKTVDYPN